MQIQQNIRLLLVTHTVVIRKDILKKLKKKKTFWLVRQKAVPPPLGQQHGSLQELPSKEAKLANCPETQVILESLQELPEWHLSSEGAKKAGQARHQGTHLQFLSWGGRVRKHIAMVRVEISLCSKCQSSQGLPSDILSQKDKEEEDSWGESSRGHRQRTCRSHCPEWWRSYPRLHPQE